MNFSAACSFHLSSDFWRSASILFQQARSNKFYFGIDLLTIFLETVICVLWINKLKYIGLKFSGRIYMDRVSISKAITTSQTKFNGLAYRFWNWENLSKIEEIKNKFFHYKQYQKQWMFGEGGSGARGYGSNFFLFFDSWGLSTLNISMGKKFWWNSQLFFSVLFSEKLELRTVYK